MDDSLDRDLGISSLERVELLLRIERACGIRLPDTVMAEAATPRDLVAAILSASPAVAEAPPLPLPATAPGIPAPASAGTLIGASFASGLKHSGHATRDRYEGFRERCRLDELGD